MRLEFQKSIASSQFLLPVVSIIITALWFVLPSATPSIDDGGTLWDMFKTMVALHSAERLVGFAFCAITVYRVAELNNMHALLRISSRMLSSVLAVLFIANAMVRELHPAHVVMVMSIIAYTFFFNLYQTYQPAETFLVYLCLSVASLACPAVLFFVPLFWLVQTYLRSLDWRSFIASFLGCILPYWLVVGIGVCMDRQDMIFEVWNRIRVVELGDYAAVTPYRWALFAYTFLTFVVGVVDFGMHAYLDKTRTRSIYNVVVTHGIATALLIGVQVQWLDALLPVLMIDAALMFGHFFVQTYSRVSHLICLVWFVMTVALTVYGVLE